MTMELAQTGPTLWPMGIPEAAEVRRSRLDRLRAAHQRHNLPVGRVFEQLVDQFAAYQTGSADDKSGFHVEAVSG